MVFREQDRREREHHSDDTAGKNQPQLDGLKRGQTLAQRDDLFRFDATMLAVAVGLSLLAGLLAGVYPAWRVCRTAPAIHLKLQ